MRPEAIEYLAEAQQRVLARLGPDVSDCGDWYTRGVQRELEPVREVMFGNMVKDEAEKIYLERQT